MLKKSHFILKALLYSYFHKTRILSLISVCLILIGCGAGKPKSSASIQINYLDDYIIPADFNFKRTRIGGLSGIDFDGKYYYVVCDSPSNPRFYQIKIKINQKKIDTITFKKLIELNLASSFIANNIFDLESILYTTENDEFILSSEGAINHHKNPSIIKVDNSGNYLSQYSLPSYFTVEDKQHPRNNGVFEGLSHAINTKGIWSSTELPLTKDGPQPQLYRTKSPVRFTYFNKQLKPEFQFSYLLAPIQKLPYLPFHINGVTDILEISPKQFLVLERSFSAGRGKRSYDVLLFKADASQATNTLSIKQLKGKMKEKVIPAQKEFLFNFKSIKKKLKENKIDNIEGICFGPQLANGNATIFVISDNNFSSFMQQLNQVIWLELQLK
ncbi:esterase-like activity of phytase family protein [Mesonia aestuariivivens]|uniref:Esterase-like activity of phytase family protein n=1 Tax=Mesonia aestuariivivens TaxID=2796128 RepID=A0ABS6W001_9FLAO|nr:esterase-like activity of phytase family protein [Mesonia aestuariivivens]MBW2961164.1 esterase-like activity of phytase family protein [Mesonia aestuariivivens]